MTRSVGGIGTAVRATRAPAVGGATSETTGPGKGVACVSGSVDEGSGGAVGAGASSADAQSHCKQWQPCASVGG